MANRLGRQVPKLRLPQRLVRAGYHLGMGQLFLEQVDTTFIQEVLETRVCWSWSEIDLGLQFVEHFLDCLFFWGVREPHLSHWAKTGIVRILTCKTQIFIYASKSNFNTELSLYWIVPSLNCCFAERSVPWLNFSVAELFLYWTVPLLKKAFTALFLYWPVSRWTSSLLNYSFPELFLYRTVPLLNYPFIELFLCWTGPVWISIQRKFLNQSSFEYTETICI